MLRRTTTWQVKRPLFVSGLMAVAVTAIALKASLAVTLACVVPAAILLFWKRLWLCGCITLCFLLVAVGYRHTYALPAEKLNGQNDTITGEVLALPTYGRMYTVRITDSAYLPSGSQAMLLCPDEESLTVGDAFTAHAELLATKSNQTYYAAHLTFVFVFPTDEEGSLQVNRHATPKTSLLQRLRAALVAVPRRTLPSRESGLLSALCFGEVGFVHPTDTEAFRGSGLSHLLVVSGLHLSMVSLALKRLFRRLGMYPCIILTLGVTWLFALFVGATPSILRAAIMLSLWLVGCMLFQRSDGLNTLGLAALLLLAANPYTLWNISFQLSFAATLGVLLLTPRLMPPWEPVADDLPWPKRLAKTAWRALIGLVAVSFSATLFTSPIACYHYGGFPLFTLPANLLAAPTAGTAMALGWLGALVGLLPFFGWLSHGLLLGAGLLMRYMGGVARLLSPHWGWITVTQLWQWLLLLTVCALIAGGILCRVSRRQVLTAILTMTVLAAGVGVPFATAPLRLTIVPVDNEGGFILQQGNRCALIVTNACDINEVTYATPTFTPDVLVVLDGDPSAITQITRWSEATVLVATPTDWTHGTDKTILPYNVGDAVTLWADCRITRLSAGWTLLQMQNETVCIGTDLDTPCPHPDGWQIAVGGVPSTPPDTHYTIVCNDTWLRRHGSTLTGRETVLFDEFVTFTPLRGEWRRLLWL